MSLVASPYGLRPVRRIDGLPYAGALDEFEIPAAGIANNLYNGTIVAIDVNGFIALMIATGADGAANAFPAGTIGVFQGCEYVNAQGQLTFSQYYPANTVAPVGTKIKAKVVTDPQVIFQAQLNGPATQTMLGGNTFLAAAQGAASGNNRTGNSNAALTTAIVATAAAFRVVGFASPLADPFGDILVKFNINQHSYLNPLGV